MTWTDPWGTSPDTLLLTTRETCGVLVVDDDEFARGVLAIGLRRHGFAVFLAADGQEALDLCWRHRKSIHVVLLDVHMPGRDGPQTFSALREIHPRIPCCVMSVNLGGYTEEGLLGMGASAVFRKPFHLDGVARTLLELASEGIPPLEQAKDTHRGWVEGARQ